VPGRGESRRRRRKQGERDMNGNRAALPWFVRRDVDGFFGLAIDNLIQLILIGTLCKGVVGMPDELVFGRILPGAAVSILLGNFFYSWQARRLAARTGRTDVTALPYGINTVSLIAFVAFVMGPVYRETGSSELAWKVGLLACLVSGLIEASGAVIGKWLRRVTPRAALLSALAGIALSFIAMDFAFKTYEKPLIALLPLGIILIQYFSRSRFPLGLPGGLVAVALGTGLGWLFGEVSWTGLSEGIHPALPRYWGSGMFQLIREGHLFKYLGIIVPMGVFNVVGSLQNIESAEAGGDSYDTFSSLGVNGIGSIVAALLGSCFPTTIYIGHPGWKGLGARAGYSTLNGIFIALICFTGTVNYVLKLIPIEAGMGILLWIGIVIVAQAFQEVPRSHAPAVALGLFPALAAWGVHMVSSGIELAGKHLSEVAFGRGAAGLALSGMISLERGFIFTSMILAAMAVHLIEKDFLKATGWTVAAVLLSFFGVIHAYRILPAGVVHDFGPGTGWEFAVGYSLVGTAFFGMYLLRRSSGDESRYRTSRSRQEAGS